jgi:hypothetical protein
MKAKLKDDKQALTEAKLEERLSKGKLSTDDLKLFEDDELRFLGPFMTKKLNELKGVEFDDFCEKVEAITPVDTKNQIWYRTHNTILSTIARLMQDYGRMPAPYEIAHEAQLSSNSVEKHLSEYAKNKKHADTKDRFEFMTSKVLARVFKYAVNGDMRAAKLYFDVVGNLGTNGSSIVNTQNNYIQINQFKLSQETVQQLTPEQLEQVEIVLKQVVNKPLEARQ